MHKIKGFVLIFCYKKRFDLLHKIWYFFINIDRIDKDGQSKKEN